MWRRILLAVGIVAVCAAKMDGVAQAAERLDAATIKMALAVPEQENRGFVERVMALVDEGTLSRQSVTIAFAKARRQQKHKFQYFKHAMIELAAAEDVILDRPEPATHATRKANWWQRLWSWVPRLTRA
jgi:hypothetical protein